MGSARLGSARRGGCVAAVRTPLAGWPTVGALVVIEGLDGAGKRTLAAALRTELTARGARVATTAFPRYGSSVEADLLTDALHGRAGDLGGSVHGMAALFALDRARARDELVDTLASNDVLVCDRYTASNAAFGAARLGEDADGELVAWVRALEIERLALPLPTVQLLLRVPVELAGRRAAAREAADRARPRDAFERDAGLQERTGAVYEGLVAAGFLAPWSVVDGGPGVDVDVAALAAQLLG